MMWEQEDTAPQVITEIENRRVEMITSQNSYAFLSGMREAVNRDKQNSDKERKDKLKILKTADSWFSKGANYQYQDNLTGAVDCYKQALVINQDHYPSAFNLAICYERISKFGCSARWFTHASVLAPNFDVARIGACFVAIKLGALHDALDLADAAITCLQENIRNKPAYEPDFEKTDKRALSKSMLSNINDYFYTKALILKLLKREKEAESLYHKSIKYFKYE